MKNQNEYVSRMEQENNMEFSKVDSITQEIQEEIRYKLNNDGLILL